LTQKIGLVLEQNEDLVILLLQTGQYGHYELRRRVLGHRIHHSLHYLSPHRRETDSLRPALRQELVPHKQCRTGNRDGQEETAH
jgi:hypothetical protein